MEGLRRGLRDAFQGPHDMTLLDAQPPKQRTGIWKYLPLPLLILLALLIGALLFIRFKNYLEERAVTHFLTTLQQGNYQAAYRLWQPAPSYAYSDFLRDWGEQGDYGKVRTFEILGSESKGSSTVIVTVRINNVDPPLDLLVDRETKGLAFSVF